MKKKVTEYKTVSKLESLTCWRLSKKLFIS